MIYKHDKSQLRANWYSHSFIISMYTCMWILSVFRSTVNQLLFVATLFRDSFVINWIAATNFRDRAVFISNVLYVIFGSRREILVMVRLREPRDSFSHTNKCWFTVLDEDMENELQILWNCRNRQYILCHSENTRLVYYFSLGLGRTDEAVWAVLGWSCMWSRIHQTMVRNTHQLGSQINMPATVSNSL
jgi:hypothetical protein